MCTFNKLLAQLVVTSAAVHAASAATTLTFWSDVGFAGNTATFTVIDGACTAIPAALNTHVQSVAFVGNPGKCFVFAGANCAGGSSNEFSAGSGNARVDYRFPNAVQSIVCNA